MLQAVACLLIATVAPQEACQLVARMGDAGGQRQHSKQGSILLAQIDDLAACPAQLETAEKREFRDRRGHRTKPLPARRRGCSRGINALFPMKTTGKPG